MQYIPHVTHGGDTYTEVGKPSNHPTLFTADFPDLLTARVFWFPIDAASVEDATLLFAVANIGKLFESLSVVG